MINVTCYYRVLGYYLLSVCFSSVFSGRAARWNREAPPILEVFLLLRKMRPSRGRCLVQGESRSTGTELGLQTTFLTPSLARGQAPPPLLSGPHLVGPWILVATLSPAPGLVPYPSMDGRTLLSPEDEPLVCTHAGIIKHSDSVMDHGLRSQCAPEAPPMTKGTDSPAAGVPCNRAGGWENLENVLPNLQTLG